MANDVMDVYLNKHDRQAAKVARDAPFGSSEKNDAGRQLAKSVSGAVPMFDRTQLIKAGLEIARHGAMFERYNTEGRRKTAKPSLLNVFRRWEYTRRPAPMGYIELRSLPHYEPVLMSIILTYQRWVTNFTRPMKRSKNPGFRITLEGRNKALSDVDQERVRWLEQSILNCGAEHDVFARDYAGRDSFKDFLKKQTLDSLTLDAMVSEIIRTGSGRPHGWVHVDGATIYLAPADGIPDDADYPVGMTDEDLDYLPERHMVKALEVSDEQMVVNWLAFGDVMYEVRNPRPDNAGFGYGIAESELLVKVITDLVNIGTYNAKSYDDNHIPNGILQMWGDFSTAQQEAFKAEWLAMVSGVENAFGLPILFGEKGTEAGANYLKLNDRVTEMAYIKWYQLRMSIMCAFYGIAPEELNLESFGTRSGGLSDGSMEAKAISSKNSGFQPFMQHLEEDLDTKLKLLDREATFEWTGFYDEEGDWERDSRALVWGELRERQGLEPTGIPMLDNAPIDGIMQGIYLQALGEQMQGYGDENLDMPPGEGDPEAGMSEEEVLAAQAQQVGKQEEPEFDGEMDRPTALQEMREALLLDD
jgi:hypothetical protein